MSPDPLLRSEPDDLLRKAASELRRQLETGQDGRAETVLHAFPSLATDPQRALELIVLEFQFRRELGQNPDPRQWYERFPQWSVQLRQRLEGSPRADVGASQQETADLGTAPYVDPNQGTLIDCHLDVPVLGLHQILQEIGRGGMGVVYRARDLILGRDVALKMIRSGNLASADEVRGFYREARSAAQLRHPNIVPIYGMGLHQGQHCFTMPLYSKGSLSRELKDQSQDIRTAAASTAKVARAVQAAHERGIIHRDLKPGNILLDDGGEPVVSDFGLAKRLDVTATQSLADQPIGTPAYMAPEQARCEPATAASDIWSLGVILYEMLTGRRPFTGDTTEMVRQRVLHADPVSPRRIRPDLPLDLETIVLKCLAKEPTQRFNSAGELADELERWLSGVPIQTRPASRWQRVHRCVRRRMGIKGVLMLLAGLLLMGTGAAGFWGLLSFFSPEARERRRQEQVVMALQRELAEGRSVTLVGPVGPPKWYRFRTDRDRPPLPEWREWPLRLASSSCPTLLELLPDPQRLAYRFSAEVHVKGDENEAGLYLSWDQQGMAAGLEHRFLLFRLSTRKNRVTKAELLAVAYQEWEESKEYKRYEISLPLKPKPVLPPNAPPPPPFQGSEKLWHRLEVLMSLGECRAFWDDCLISSFSPAQDWKMVVVGLTTHLASSSPPTFYPRGGLGVFVQGGPAQFRNVVVEPLLEQ